MTTTTTQAVVGKSSEVTKLEARTARIEASMNIYEGVKARLVDASLSKVGPTDYFVFDPMHRHGPAKINDDTSKCYQFDEFAQLFDHGRLEIIPKKARSLLEQFSIEPLCLTTNNTHHLGWKITTHNSISMTEFYTFKRSMIRLLLNFLRLEKEDREGGRGKHHS